MGARPRLEIEMSNENHKTERALQREARAWAELTGTKYTAALRQLHDPLTKGLLGDRISAHQFISTLGDHSLIGAKGGQTVLSENGFLSEGPWSFDGRTDYVKLALIADALRMFTPTRSTGGRSASSYSLKHTLEQFLKPYCTYVSNGQVIWAAAAIGLPLYNEDGQGPNLMIGISEREHDYVRRAVDSFGVPIRAHHHRPPGLDHLESVLPRAGAGEIVSDVWQPSIARDDASPFHDWLLQQVGRVDPVGTLAQDYSRGIHDSDHRIAHTPDALLGISRECSFPPDVYSAVVYTLAEWFVVAPSQVPLRTECIGENKYDHDDWESGPGVVEVLEYFCPCGSGEIVEEHDNSPGLREHHVSIRCERCITEWRLAEKPVRYWGLVPIGGCYAG